MTRRDRPRAASQAANTSIVMGNMLARVEWVFRIIMVMITNRESIIPSRQSSEDIMWERYISIPTKEIVKAIMMFVYVIDI